MKGRYHSEGFVPPSRSDLDELRERVREFARREIPESLAYKTDQQDKFPKELWRKMGNAGLLGITAPSAHTGLGMGYQAHCIVMEELSRASGSIGLSYAAHSQLCINQLSLHGTEEQKRVFLPGLVSGELVGGLAMSEESAGSDVVSMKTKALPRKTTGEGNIYEINGSKMWITNGSLADVLVVYAKSNPEAGSKGISAFTIPTRYPSPDPPSDSGTLISRASDSHREGFQCARTMKKLGMRGSPTAELHFTSLPVHSNLLLGGSKTLNRGARVLMSGLDLERLVLSAGPIGLMQRALDEVVPYVWNRKQFGKEIGKLQLVQGRVADIYTRLAAARALTMNVARDIDENHENFPIEAEGLPKELSRACTSAILFAAEAATKAALDAVQLLGGMGYVEEEGCAPVGRLVRDAKLYEIGAGTSEVRRVVIGRSFEDEGRNS